MWSVGGGKSGSGSGGVGGWCLSWWSFESEQVRSAMLIVYFISSGHVWSRRVILIPAASGSTGFGDWLPSWLPCRDCKHSETSLMGGHVKTYVLGIHVRHTAPATGQPFEQGRV